jgi:hypothetical protein
MRVLIYALIRYGGVLSFFLTSALAKADFGIGLSVQSNAGADGWGLHAFSQDLMGSENKDKIGALRLFYSLENFEIINLDKDDFGQYQRAVVSVSSLGLRIEDVGNGKMRFFTDLGFRRLLLSGRLASESMASGGFSLRIGTDFMLGESEALFLGVDLIPLRVRSDLIAGRPEILPGRTLSLGYKRLF